MPLTFSPPGEEAVILKIGGNAQVRAHLEKLGFTAGSVIRLVSEIGGNVIVHVKDSRIAVSREMAQKISVRRKEVCIH